MSNTKYPPYVNLGTTAMHWDSIQNKYWRSAGAWGCKVEERDGKLFSSIPEYPWIHNIELIPITKEEWAKDNGKYI